MVESGHFGVANSRGIEEFEHDAVAQAEGIGGVWQGEQPGDFVGIKGFRQVASLFTRQVKISGGIGWNHAGAAQPGEEAAHTAKAGELGVDDQRFFGTRRAVVVEVELVGLKGGAGERGGTSPRSIDSGGI